MIFTALAVAIGLVLLVRIFLLIEQLRQRSYSISYFSNHDVPLIFPQGCPNCREPATIPWVYTEAPESHCCPKCQMSFQVSFVPGGVGIAPQYAWEEQNPRVSTHREALVPSGARPAPQGR